MQHDLSEHDGSICHWAMRVFDRQAKAQHHHMLRASVLPQLRALNINLKDCPQARQEIRDQEDMASFYLTGLNYYQDCIKAFPDHFQAANDWAAYPENPQKNLRWQSQDTRVQVEEPAPKPKFKFAVVPTSNPSPGETE